MSEATRLRSALLVPDGSMAGDDALVHAASLAELGVMTASLLHELRQPLFAIKAHAQLGRAEEAGGAVGRTDRYARILDQVRHIEELIRYYGSVARHDEPEVLFDLNEPIRTAIDMVSYRARKVGVEVDTALSSQVLLTQGREMAARQVAINLLQNACDAVEEQPERVIIVRTREIGDVVRLEVEDNGPGVPVDLRTRLFEPFVTTKPPGRGTGLGLYIAQRLVHEAKGTLRVIAPEGGGTRFEVDLPRAETVRATGSGDASFG